jgi:hypothetical protein
VLLVAAGLTAAVMPRRPSAWPAPAVAAALALIGLAGAWPALVVRLRLGLWQRAALAGSGLVWLAVAGPLAGAHLFTTNPKLPLPAVWTTSLPVTLHDVLRTLAFSGVPVAALVWAVAAAILPWLTRERHPVWNVGVVTVWSAVSVSVVQMVGPPHLYGLVSGAVLGALVLVMGDLPGLLVRLRSGDGPLPRLP